MTKEGKTVTITRWSDNKYAEWEARLTVVQLKRILKEAIKFQDELKRGEI